MEALLVVLGTAVLYAFASLRVLKQYERGVAFMLGKFWATKGPGLVFVPAIVAKMQRISLRIIAMDIQPQDKTSLHATTSRSRSTRCFICG